LTLTVLPVPKPRAVHRPYFILAVLQCLDVVLTCFILTFWAGHAQEGNPLARLLTDYGTPGFLILLAFKLGTVALLWYCQTRVRLASALYGLVVANNVVFLLGWLVSR
jgi:hypothetical protein